MLTDRTVLLAVAIIVIAEVVTNGAVSQWAIDTLTEWIRAEVVGW